MRTVPTRAEIAAAFDAIADEFNATRVRPWPETLALNARLPEGARVLDLACGNGRNVVALREHGQVVVGLDASRRLLAHAAAKVGTSRLLRGDIVCLPFRDGSFDGVHAVAGVHHLPSEGERRQCLAECARVLRPGGLLLISAWAAEQDRFRGIEERPTTDVDVPWRRSDGAAVSRFYHLFRRGELESIVYAAGLAVVRAWREGDNHAVLAARPGVER